MLIGEPARTQGDLNFQIGGIPVRVTPWFWIIAVLLGWSSSNNGNPRLLLTWVLAVFASIMIHELGHALAFRYYGLRAHVVLYQFGGLAVPDTYYGDSGSARQRSPSAQIVISAAGPGLQMLVALLLSLGLIAGGYEVPLGGFVASLLRLPSGAILQPDPLLFFVLFFLYVSVYWAILNLLPIYPLDGGQIARQLLVVFGSREAVKHSLILSLGAAVLVAIRGFTLGDTYLGILFGMLAYSSYTALQPLIGSGGYRRPW